MARVGLKEYPMDQADYVVAGSCVRRPSVDSAHGYTCIGLYLHLELELDGSYVQWVLHRGK